MTALERHFCITGGAGFIGSHLADALISAGARVRVIDDLSTGNADNLAAIRDQIEFVDASILQPHALDAALADVDTVVHLAAYVSAPGSVREPSLCHEINSTGTLRVLEACQRRGVRRIILASSAAVYGDSEVVPKREDQPLLPCSVYAQSKAAGEHLLRVWSHCHGIESVSLRFFNVFGPRQSASSAYAAAIAAFADAITKRRPITIFGDGTQTRDFVPVANVVQCLLLASTWNGPARGDCFNVGMGHATSIRELARVMAQIAGIPDSPSFAPPRPGDVLHSLASIDAATEILGYRPATTVRAGLSDAMAWYGAAAANATQPARPTN
jgi:UDP-glucose 4-epimerase